MFLVWTPRALVSDMVWYGNVLCLDDLKLSKRSCAFRKVNSTIDGKNKTKICFVSFKDLTCRFGGCYYFTISRQIRFTKAVRTLYSLTQRIVLDLDEVLDLFEPRKGKKPSDQPIKTVMTSALCKILYMCQESVMIRWSLRYAFLPSCLRSDRKWIADCVWLTTWQVFKLLSEWKLASPAQYSRENHDVITMLTRTLGQSFLWREEKIYEWK